MICGIFGVPQLSLNKFHFICQESCLSHALLTSSGLTKFKCLNTLSVVPVFVDGVRVAKRHASRIKAKVALFIADNSLHLDAVDAVMIAAVATDSSQFIYSAVTPEDIRKALQDCENSNRDLSITPRPLSVLQEAMTESKSSSLLGSLQTVIYRIKSPSVRNRMQSMVYDWLCGNISKTKLIQQCRQDIPKFVIFLDEILADESFPVLRESLVHMTKTGDSIEQVQAIFHVPIHDLHYLSKKRTK